MLSHIFSRGHRLTCFLSVFIEIIVVATFGKDLFLLLPNLRIVRRLFSNTQEKRNDFSHYNPYHNRCNSLWILCKTLVDKPFGMVVFHSNKNEIYLKNTVELQGQLDTKYGTHQFQPWYTGSGGLQISLII